MDWITFLPTFVSGGFAGAVLKALLDWRNNRLQKISLIERVNRSVNPDIKGITLARVANGADTNKLEAIKNVHEYQLTLRNTSSIHLKDVEVQFEFSAEDVEAWAERPALSKTEDVPVVVEG